MAAADLAGAFHKKQFPTDRRPSNAAATVVIPNWNGRDLLEKYLPSVIEALAAILRNEIIVVDNGSSDGSAAIRCAIIFRRYDVLALDRNLGFGGGSNAGFRAAKNDIVVLLNSDMRVQPDFFAPLLHAFTDEKCSQYHARSFSAIRKSFAKKPGLPKDGGRTAACECAIAMTPAIQVPFPVFTAAAAHARFDRRKFLELGGFDELLRPFYLEDTDLGYLAWKRGWKVLYQPRSVVYHEHRGTIGKQFPNRKSIASSRRISSCFAGKIFTNGGAWPRTSSSPSPALF